MKFSIPSKSHIVLAGAVVAVIALFVYMWLDMRNLDRLPAPEVKSISQTSSSEDSGTTAAHAKIGDVPITVRREPGERKSPLQQRSMRHEELAEVSTDFFRRQPDTAATGSANVQAAGSNTDDWMFESGKDVEAAEPEPIDAEATSVPE